MMSCITPTKRLRHVVQRPVGEDDRVLEQSIGIDLGPRKAHAADCHTERGRAAGATSGMARRSFLHRGGRFAFMSLTSTQTARLSRTTIGMMFVSRGPKTLTMTSPTAA